MFVIHQDFDLEDYCKIQDAMMRYHTKLPQRTAAFFCHDGAYRNGRNLLRFYDIDTWGRIIQHFTGKGTFPVVKADEIFLDQDVLAPLQEHATIDLTSAVGEFEVPDGFPDVIDLTMDEVDVMLGW